jgi:hypothetical protein
MPCFERENLQFKTLYNGLPYTTKSAKEIETDSNTTQRCPQLYKTGNWQIAKKHDAPSNGKIYQTKIQIKFKYKLHIVIFY